MKPVLAILLSLAFVHAMAQHVREFGDVSPAEFITDTTHSSVILFNVGRYTVNGPYASFDRHIRARLNSNQSLHDWGHFELGSNYASIARLQAASYTLINGKVETVPLAKENIYKDKKSGKNYLALPGLRENSIVEISFRVIYEVFIVPYWNIQTSVPVLHSEYLSNAYPLTYLIRTGLKPTQYDEKYKDNGTYNRWIFKNVPAFEREPGMPDPRNYYSRMEFWYPDKSWDETSWRFLQDYKKLLSHAESRQIKVELARLLDPVSDPLERVRIIWTYVKDNYSTTNSDDLLSDSPTTLYESRKGSSGDLNVLLYHLLELHDFKPAFLLKTTSGHVIKNLPSYHQFDHALCLIQLQGKEYYLDASEKSLPFHIIPQRCLGEVFVVLEKGHAWRTLVPEIKEKININLKLSLDENQALAGTWRAASTGYGAYEKRKQYQDMGAEKYKKETIVSPHWESDSSKILNTTPSDLPFVESHTGRIHNAVTAAADKIYITPIFSNPDTSRWPTVKRQYPIDLKTPTDRTLLCSIAIPENYSIESLPASVTHTMPDKSLSFSYKVTSNEKTIVIACNVSVKNTWFEPESYSTFVNFYGMSAAKVNEPIVLVKVK